MVEKTANKCSTFVSAPTREDFGAMCGAYLAEHGADALSELLATLLLNAGFYTDSKDLMYKLDVGQISVKCMPKALGSVH